MPFIGLWKFAWVVKWDRVVTEGHIYRLEITFDNRAAAEKFYNRIVTSPERPLKLLIEGDYYRCDHPAEAVILSAPHRSQR